MKSSENRPRPTGAGVGPIEILFNPRSGAHDQAQAHACIAAVLAASGRDYRFVPIERPEAIGKLARSLGERARECDGAVVAAGGDGTINAVVQGLLGTDCRFGVLPMGTFNYVARNHRIPLALDAATRVLIEGETVPLQVGRVNDRIFLVNASLGLYPRLLEQREQAKRRFGRSRLVALLSALITLLAQRGRLRLQLHVEGIRDDVETSTLFVGNNRLQLEQVGMVEAASIDHGLLAALHLKPIDRLGLLALAFRGSLGLLGDAREVTSFAFREMSVSQPRRRPFRRRPPRIKVATDGETGWMSMPLQFAVVPEPVFLLGPTVDAEDGRAESRDG